MAKEKKTFACGLCKKVFQHHSTMVQHEKLCEKREKEQKRKQLGESRKHKSKETGASQKEFRKGEVEPGHEENESHSEREEDETAGECENASLNNIVVTVKIPVLLPMLDHIRIRLNPTLSCVFFYTGTIFQILRLFLSF